MLWTLEGEVYVLSHSAFPLQEIRERNKVSQGLTVSSAVTLAYLITAKWCLQSKEIISVLFI